ncbi:MULTISPECIES: hypothetical protein [Neisseria]|uniref:Uncharacterized protein n=1 Tax=Neisseria musculi TaxID=1815583 RepID=A0A7H1M9F6_9NEIS|nr:MULTISPECIES: hypothetical protein [Neisseria]MBF0803196.1 hypothetical protein [Neisseria sp. 19428wB4_WF04]QNT58271.1 hypothetical protein H7A79_2611 [Neisseria musculi]TFU44168.1 hypothetical protein E4T99_02290 [Neisseria sp. WF04]TFV06893.1 hypothetical protein E4T85_19770 [Bacillus stratosphericus]
MAAIRQAAGIADNMQPGSVAATVFFKPKRNNTATEIKAGSSRPSEAFQTAGLYLLWRKDETVCQNSGGIGIL